MDNLTGLLSREEFKNIKPRDDLYVVQLNIHKMQSVNDCCGHEIGDELIKVYAKVLSDLFDWNNIFKIDGDRFFLLCEYNNLQSTLNTIFDTIDIDIVFTVYARKNPLLATFDEKLKSYSGNLNEIGVLYIESVNKKMDLY